MRLYAPRSLAYNVIISYAKFLFRRLAVLSLFKRLTTQAKHQWTQRCFVQLVSVSGEVCVIRFACVQ